MERDDKINEIQEQLVNISGQLGRTLMQISEEHGIDIGFILIMGKEKEMTSAQLMKSSARNKAKALLEIEKCLMNLKKSYFEEATTVFQTK